MGSRTAALLGGSLVGLLGLTAWAAQPVFDQGVDASEALDAAKAAAAQVPGVPAKAAATVPAPEPGSGGAWITLQKADTVQPDAANLPLGMPIEANSSRALYHVSEDRLPEISAYMHAHYKRCAGFFAHANAADAEKDLKDSPGAAGGPYTLDQAERVKPLMGQVQEGNLHATIDALAALNNRYYTADTGVEASQWILGQWQALAGKLPGASAQLVSHSGWKQPSVVLTIPGAQSADEIVVLGGHLDSINQYGGSQARAPGADDNASGIAVLTEAARVLAESGFKPKRTIQFMAYAAEEVGLRGSQEIASQYADAGKKVVGVIQFDMTNYAGAGDGIYLLDDNVDENLTAFLGKLIEAYVGVSWGTTSCGYACSDHASWTRSGFPASAAFESTFDGMNRHIHSEEDTLANSGGDAKHSVVFAKLAAAFAIETAKSAGKSTASSGR